MARRSYRRRERNPNRGPRSIPYPADLTVPCDRYWPRFLEHVFVVGLVLSSGCIEQSYVKMAKGHVIRGREWGTVRVGLSFIVNEFCV